jgi:hypothetical protein
MRIFSGAFRKSFISLSKPWIPFLAIIFQTAFNDSIPAATFWEGTNYLITLSVVVKLPAAQYVGAVTNTPQHYGGALHLVADKSLRACLLVNYQLCIASASAREGTQHLPAVICGNSGRVKGNAAV